MSVSVAIDIDGVLNNQFYKFNEIANRYGITDTEWQKTYSGIYKAYDKENVSLADRVFKDHLEEFLLGGRPMKGARKSFQCFVDNKHFDVYIVTSRYEENRDLTDRWLKENGFVGQIDTLYMKDKTKAPCQVLIDDHVKHIKSYIDKARMGVLVDAVHNQDSQVGYRVENLQKAYEYLIQFI
ncbi:MAG TPA: hypothetical protein VK982_15000 [Bacteroidales bacterium]|nr:hypothetical protein [Bacteroidales bacterium]